MLTDQNGESTVRNLFAIGGTACTGLHGANRLASNFFLRQGFVFAVGASHAIRARLPDIPTPYDLPEWDERTSDPDEQVVIAQVWDEIRRFM